MNEFWTLARVARALGGGPCDDRPIRAVCTDTRAIERGDLFVALKGENHDAHDYLQQAVAKGATAVVIQRAEAATGLGVPAYVVGDTLHALGLLGQARRRAWGGPVVAVGGSNGKTSTKELIRAALGARLDVHATKGNLNNQIGVPLTLLAIPDGADVAVIELGTNVPGEIALLRAIAEPTIAVITTVQEEHLEGFGDLAGVMRRGVAARRRRDGDRPLGRARAGFGIGAPRAPHRDRGRRQRRRDGRRDPSVRGRHGERNG
jgi:UDP-N-acetylmuramoyl-tripeptide--D-alanyl-D-alanine ligase